MERKGSPVSASERSLAHRGAQVGDSGAHVGAGADYMRPTSNHWRASGEHECTGARSLAIPGDPPMG